MSDEMPAMKSARWIWPARSGSSSSTIRPKRWEPPALAGMPPGVLVNRRNDWFSAGSGAGFCDLGLVSIAASALLVLEASMAHCGGRPPILVVGPRPAVCPLSAPFREYAHV